MNKIEVQKIKDLVEILGGKEALKRLKGTGPAGSGAAACYAGREAGGGQGDAEARSEESGDVTAAEAEGGDKRSDLQAYSDWFNGDDAERVLKNFPLPPLSEHWPTIAEIFVAGRKSTRVAPQPESEADASRLPRIPRPPDQTKLY